MSYNEPSSQPVRPVLPERTNSQITVAPSDQRKDKDKKGLFGKWGGEKKSKKEERLERERDKEREKEKEKQSTFSFGSLFGGSKKKHEESSAHGMGHHGHNAGREAAVALLGASKSKSGTPSPSPQLPGVNNYSRYPIHVERAIYRLSHIKLANPRRALRNSSRVPRLVPRGAGAVGAGGAAQNAQNASPEEKERQDAERKEKEERERAEKEQAEKERERERERAEQKAQSRRGSLTKTPAAGTGAGNRKAEMPVRGPQYDMQHRAMEQEYGPDTKAAPSRRRSHSRSPSARRSITLAQQYPTHPCRIMCRSGRGARNSPPGAMPPIDPDLPQYPSPSSPTPVTRVSSNPPSQRTKSPPGGHANPRHSRSPPPQNRYAPSSERVPQPGVGAGGSVKAPGRSRSATATPQPPPVSLNGKTRKTTSAHATVASPARRPRTSEGPEGGGEEDVPLAVWQQQQSSRRR
ncbi:hypothetical protein EVG20_g5607 [Dentipellis fragilis]|uniref:Protein Zds1 C-terminal domain-containing protein n=1 Tax=Dentipellis fragilis TaxID=205917 RepID=A0A4Y9YWB2_9AGAM|nr:hypothetical protein EVG20_g5607 [Dentipellis fragilis]